MKMNVSRWLRPASLLAALLVCATPAFGGSGSLTLGSGATVVESPGSGLINAGVLNLSPTGGYVPSYTGGISGAILRIGGGYSSQTIFETVNVTIEPYFPPGIVTTPREVLISRTVYPSAALLMDTSTALSAAPSGNLLLSNTTGGSVSFAVNVTDNRITTASGLIVRADSSIPLTASGLVKTGTGTLTLSGVSGTLTSIVSLSNGLLIGGINNPSGTNFGTITSAGGVGTGSATVVSNAEASVRGSYAPLYGDADARYRIEYGVHQTYGSLQQVEFTATSTLLGATIPTTRAFSTVLDGLQPSTTYHYRTKIVRQAADGTVLEILYGPDRTFTTQPILERGPFWITGDSLTLTPNAMSQTGSLPLVTTTDGQPLRAVFVSRAQGTTGTSTLTPDALVYTPGPSFVKQDSFRVRLAYANAPVPGIARDPVAGTTSFLVNVTVAKPSLPVAVTQPAIVGSNNHAQLNATFEANGPSPDASFQIGLTTAYGVSVKPVQLIRNDGVPVPLAQSALVPDLLPGTTYHYRAKLTNSLGTTYGADATFTTAPAYAVGEVISNGQPVTMEALSRVTAGWEYILNGSVSHTYSGVTVITGGILTIGGNTGALNPANSGATATSALGVAAVTSHEPQISSRRTRSTSTHNVTFSSGTIAPNRGNNTVSGGAIYGSGVNMVITGYPSIPLGNSLGSFTKTGAGTVVVGAGSFLKRVSRTFPAAHGTVTSNGIDVTYTPNETFAGYDTFDYEIGQNYGGILGVANLLPARVPFRVTVRVRSSLAASSVVSGSTSVAGITTPNVGLFSGRIIGDRSKAPAIFSGAGALKLTIGDAAPWIIGSRIVKLGEPSGGAVIATLAAQSGVVSATNDVVLINGLDAEPAVAAREGQAFANAPELRIKSFGAIDGNGSVTFFLVTLQGAGVTAKNDLALAAAPRGGPATLLVREGQEVNGLMITGLATLVGSAGTLAEGRWRTGDQSCGVRLTFANGAQGLFSIPVAAASPAEWTASGPWDAQGLRPQFVGSGAEWEAAQFLSYGLPGFGKGSTAVRATLKPGVGGVTRADNVILFAGGAEVARKGQLLASDGPTYFADFADPVGGGALGRIAFAATLGGGGTTAADRASLWFVPGGIFLAPVQIARANGNAPGGGTFARFTSLVLPDGPASTPLFTAILAVKDGVTAKTNTGLWAGRNDGGCALLLRTGQLLSIDGTRKEDHQLHRARPRRELDRRGPRLRRRRHGRGRRHLRGSLDCAVEAARSVARHCAAEPIGVPWFHEIPPHPRQPLRLRLHHGLRRRSEIRSGQCHQRHRGRSREAAERETRRGRARCANGG